MNSDLGWLLGLAILGNRIFRLSREKSVAPDVTPQVNQLSKLANCCVRRASHGPDRSVLLDCLSVANSTLATRPFSPGSGILEKNRGINQAHDASLRM